MSIHSLVTKFYNNFYYKNLSVYMYTEKIYHSFFFHVNFSEVHYISGAEKWTVNKIYFTKEHSKSSRDIENF